MKYIRTKDGIYEVYTDDLDLNNESNRDIAGFRLQHCKGWNYPLKKEDILRVADTIEELCDVIVCNEKLFYPLTSNREGNKFNWEEIISCSHNVICNADYKGKAEDLYFNIYGAIWTDKGLIYIAKMNEEGVLCLI